MVSGMDITVTVLMESLAINHMIPIIVFAVSKIGVFLKRNNSA